MSLNVTSIYKAADEMGINRKLALWHRCNFLKSEMRLSADRIVAFEFLEEPVAYAMARIEQDEVFNVLAKELRSVALAMHGYEPKKGDITEEMKERAGNALIESVINFNRGVAPCFAHADKRPSMSHWRAGNKASCFVCGKKWDAIDVLRERDGMSYPAAVKYLCGM